MYFLLTSVKNLTCYCDALGYTAASKVIIENLNALSEGTCFA